ncbi:mevalonate kinase-like [Porites lutea]|uniref:mevalonate kinase-like n=1 Tax=Porites lutea TaxID=51062 RepID=UPI003CC65F71
MPMGSHCIRVTAPGKIILHGEHAVVYGKKAVATAIGLRTVVKLESQRDQLVRLSLQNFNITCKWKQDELQKDVNRLLAFSGCPHEASALFNKFVEHCQQTEETKKLMIDAIRVFVFLVGKIVKDVNRLGSFSIEINSSIPIGAGLGSSASCSVCLVTALLAAMEAIPSVQETTTATLSVSEGQGTISLPHQDLALICHWSLEAEKLVHGNPSGVDNSICTYGGALTFEDSTLNCLTRIPQLKILITNTKVARSTKDLVSGLRERYQQLPAVYSTLFDAIGAIADECCVCLEKLYHAQATPNTTWSNLQEHYGVLENLIDLNQQLLVTLGVSHSSLDELCCVTSKYGLHSKLTGAGGGGCAFTLVTPDSSEKSVSDVIHDLTNLGFEVWDTCLGDEGVTLQIS